MTAIRRFLFLAFLLALAVPAAHAQFTTVTAQVKDPTGQLYTSCQVSAAFVPSPSATTQPFINGGLFPTVVPVFACDSSANFSLTLADNNQVSDGRGGGPVSQWRFSICSAPGKYPGPQYCFTYTGTITGATLDLTAPIQSVAAVLPASSGGGGGNTVNNNIRYASASGSDANDGKTWGTAKATWDAACESLPGGGIVSGAHYCGVGTINIDYQIAACSNAGYGVQVLGNTATAFYPISSTCWENQSNGEQVNTVCAAGILAAFSGAGFQNCTITGGGTADNWHPGLWLSGADGMSFAGLNLSGQGVNIITGYCPDQTAATSGNGCGAANLYINGLSTLVNKAAANGPGWLFGPQGLFIHVYNFSMVGNPSATGGITADAAQPVLIKQGSGGSGDLIFQAGHLQDGGFKVYGGVGTGLTLRDINNDNDAFHDTEAIAWIVSGLGPYTIDNLSFASDCGTPVTDCFTVRNDTGTAVAASHIYGTTSGLIQQAPTVPEQAGTAFVAPTNVSNTTGFLSGSYFRAQTDDAAREFPAIIAPYTSLLATNLNSLTVCGTCTLTTGITDPSVVGTRAIQISDSGAGDNITMTATGDGGAVNGDTFLAGLWIKPATAGNCCSAGTAGLMTFFLNASGDHCSQTGTQDVAATPRTTDSLWEHYIIRCDISAYPTSGAPTLQVSVGSSQTMQYAYPELILLHGYTSSEIADIALHLGSWDGDNCIAGLLCTVGTPGLSLRDYSSAQNAYSRVLFGDNRVGSPGQVGFGSQSTGNDLAGTSFLLNISPGTGDVLSASGFPNIDLGVLPSGKVGVHTLDTASTTPACYGSQTMNTVSLNTLASCNGLTISGHIIATGLQSTGTPANSLCTDSSHNVIEFSAADCFGGGGGGVVLQTNGVNNSSQTTFNLINSAAFNGLTSTFTNTSGGIVQAGFTGTLGNAGITNPQTTVNGQTCTLGGTCNIPFQINGVSNTSLTALNFLNSSSNAIGLAITPSNPGTNQVKWESTGTLLPVGGGTGKDSSGSTGVAQVLSGTWSFSTALANGTTGTTQATNDSTTKVATDAFVQNTTSLPNLATVGTIGTGTWQGTAVGSTYGGTGINSSASTGVPHVTSGTWAVSTALPNGTTATTQSNGDSSTDVATDQFVINNTLTNPMTTLGDSMYGGASGVVTRLAGPTGPNGVPQTWIDVPAAGAAVAETWALSGVPLNAQTGTTYTFAATDRVSRVTFSNASAIAVTLPQAGTTGFGSNFVTNACDIGAGTATITPTTSTVSYVNGQAYTSAAATVAIATGQCVTIYSDNTNYFATLYQSGTTGTAGGDLSGSYPNPTVAKVNGAAVPTSAAVLASNGSNQLTASTPHQVTLPLQCADTSSSATTYTCTTTPSLGALTTGDTFILTGINQNNSGSSTLNIDAIGAKTIKKYQNSSNLAAGDLQLGGTARLTYDGTNLELDTIGQAPAGSGTVGSCATTGAVGIYGTAPSTTIGCGNADFTYATHTLTAGSLGLVDLSAEASGGLKIPVAAGATSAADGSIDYDSTNKNTHIRANGADAIAAAESSAVVVNTLAKSSSSTVGLLVGSSIVDNGTNITSTEPVILGTDGSTAGSVQLANSGAAFHSIITSAATANNTVSLFATAPTTGDLVSCTTATTTCTLTDSTVAASNVVTAASNASAAKQLCTASGASKTCSYIDYPQVFSIPACYNNNGTASGVDGTTATSVACTLRAGTNNKGAFYGPFTTSDSITWQIHIPADADLTNFPPYIDLDLASTDATNSHTIIMQESIACAKLDGSTTDDVAFNAARSLATVTLNGNANRSWNTTITTNSTDMTGCAAPGLMWVKITRTTDTATNVELWGGNITIPRLLTVQAN